MAQFEESSFSHVHNVYSFSGIQKQTQLIPLLKFLDSIYLIGVCLFWLRDSIKSQPYPNIL